MTYLLTPEICHSFLRYSSRSPRLRTPIVGFLITFLLAIVKMCLYILFTYNGTRVSTNVGGIYIACDMSLMSRYAGKTLARARTAAGTSSVQHPRNGTQPDPSSAR